MKMRLVDADMLKETIDNSDEYAVYKMEFKGYVDRCETAYDIDKVVDQLKKMKRDADSFRKKKLAEGDWEHVIYHKARFEAFLDAIAVVKGGGKHD